MRKSIAGLPLPAERFAQRSGSIRLLVLGGSQGALALNRTVPEALALLDASSRPIVRHQCGRRTLETAKAQYQRLGVDAELPEFIEDMAEAYGWADFVICRAGALTVAELCAAGLGAIFIPYPAAVDDHQTANARGMQEAGAALIIAEKDLTPEKLATEIRDWTNRGRLLERANVARSLAHPNALERITSVCLEQAGVTP